MAGQQPAPSPNELQFLTTLIWQFSIIGFVLYFKDAIVNLLNRVSHIKVGQTEITMHPKKDAQPSPSAGEEVSYKHISLLHSSWRYKKADARYGKRMWSFHVIVIANTEVMRRIKLVKYQLHPDYKEYQTFETDDIGSKFSLKQLAWDESVVRAKIIIEGQENPVYLNRYINLTDEGPRLGL